MCSNIGGCSGVASSFGPTAISEINTYLQTVGCLTLVPSIPQISSVTPVLLQTVGPAIVTLGGSGFLGATTVTVGGQPLASGLQVLSDVQLRFSPPVGLNLGVHSATVTNSAGTSNAVFLIYQGSNPCRIIAPLVVQGGSTHTWRLGGWQNGMGYLGVSLTDTMVPARLPGADRVLDAVGRTTGCSRSSVGDGSGSASGAGRLPVLLAARR
jgi:hypothetical protein